MFKIDVENLSWINGEPNDVEDLCAHGYVIAQIGNEYYDYNATVSATALYLLKSLSEDHFIDESEQMLPCCGFTIYARDKQLNCVDIIGCCNGIDWSVIHTDGHVKLITSTGKEALIPFSNINFSFDFITKRFPGSQSINRHRYQPLFYPERCMALP